MNNNNIHLLLLLSWGGGLQTFASTTNSSPLFANSKYIFHRYKAVSYLEPHAFSTSVYHMIIWYTVTICD